ncbi:hypothetical protein D3C76_1493410 [compost metagenome]
MNEHLVLVECDQCSKASRSNPFHQDHIVWAITRNDFMSSETSNLLRSETQTKQLLLDFVQIFTLHQRLTLSNAVGIQPLLMIRGWIVADHRRDKIDGDHLGALMQ